MVLIFFKNYESWGRHFLHSVAIAVSLQLVAYNVKAFVLLGTSSIRPLDLHNEIII
jgi:hypothetical protein